MSSYTRWKLEQGGWQFFSLLFWAARALLYLIFLVPLLLFLIYLNAPLKGDPDRPTYFSVAVAMILSFGGAGLIFQYGLHPEGGLFLAVIGVVLLVVLLRSSRQVRPRPG